MKQGKLYTKLILWIFLAAVVCYFGYYVFSAVYAPLTTVTAIEYEAGAGSYTTGYVVRDETVIQSHYEITTLVVAEGERVSAGQALATGYRNTDAQARQVKIQELEHQLEQLQYAASYAGDAAGQAILDSEIQTHLENMSQYVARRDMNAVEDRSAALKGLILRRTSSETDNAAMDQRILDLTTQLEGLRDEASADTRTVGAGMSGFFSGNVDGFEKTLTVESLDTLTVAALDALTPGEAEDTALGKIITDSTWYYVTSVPTELVREARVGRQIPVTFSSVFYDDLNMTIERIGGDENGESLLVLSCDLYMQDVTLLREQSADVVFTSYSGLRVPKEAIRVTTRSEIFPGADVKDNGEKLVGVYVLEGRTASWKTVKPLHDNGETYVVELDKSSTDNLWPGDEIIVNAPDLYDGKVVR